MNDLIINGHTIHNAPDYAKDYPFIVVYRADDGLWFYGAYEDRRKAWDVEFEVRGTIVENFERCSKCSHYVDLDTSKYDCDYNNCCGGEPDDVGCDVFETAELIN